MPQDSSFPEPTQWNGGPDEGHLRVGSRGKTNPASPQPSPCIRCGRSPRITIVSEGAYCSWTCYRLEGEGGTNRFLEY